MLRNANVFDFPPYESRATSYISITVGGLTVSVAFAVLLEFAVAAVAAVAAVPLALLLPPVDVDSNVVGLSLLPPPV